MSDFDPEDYTARKPGTRRQIIADRAERKYELEQERDPEYEVEITREHIQDLRQHQERLAEIYLELIAPFSVPGGLITAVRELNARIIRAIQQRPTDLHLLHHRQFEQLVAEILASFGWRVELSSTTRDGGYDIFALSRDPSGLETPWLVECKKYRADRPVGVEIVRSLWGVKTDLRVGSGLIATTANFTRDALKYKESRYDLALRDFEALVEWLNLYRPLPSGRLYLDDYRLRIGHLPRPPNIDR